MSILILVYVLTTVVSIAGLLWLSAIEFKKYDGYAELNLGDILYSVVFGVLPVVNVIALIGFAAYMGESAVVWSSKPDSIKKLNL